MMLVDAGVSLIIYLSNLLVTAGMSLSTIHKMEEVKKHDRFYLRYYLTIKKARLLNDEVYGDQVTKNKYEYKV